jgi:hypothetical protein
MPFRSLVGRTPVAASLADLRLYGFRTSSMNRHTFNSPVVVTIEIAPGRTRQYPIRDLYKAMAVMRWYKLRPLIDLRAVNPGVWLVAAAAMARAHQHPDPAAVEHAREMFVVLAKTAGILAGL